LSPDYSKKKTITTKVVQILESRRKNGLRVRDHPKKREKKKSCQPEREEAKLTSREKKCSQKKRFIASRRNQ